MPIDNEITKEELEKLQNESELELIFESQLKSYGYPYEKQFQPFDDRKHRWDFKLSDLYLVDIQGGIWSGGAHVRGKGYTNDCEKLNLASSRGWKPLWFTGDQVKSGEAIEFLREHVFHYPD